MSYLVEEHSLSVQRSCNCLRLSRSAYYKGAVDWSERDAEVVDQLNKVLEKKPRYGFWKCCTVIRRKGFRWNHKRIYRVYCKLGLNHKRRAKKRLPKRVKEPLFVPDAPNQVWSADFMSDALYAGKRFRTFNVIDDFNREVLAIEVDTSLTSKRLIRVFEQLRKTRGLPKVLRVDNGPEFMSAEFVAWAEEAGMTIRYIQPGEPNQNAYIERFNRTYREEVLNLYLFRSLHEVREITSRWIDEYNDLRPHDALGGLPPSVYATRKLENSTLEVST